MKIGIFGGAFNPPHKMHEDLAKELLNQGAIDKFIFVPVGDRYEKNESIAADYRLEMVKIICDKNSNMELSDYECKNELVSTYMTLDYFKSLYPNDEIFFICGTDNLIDFENWARPDYILENYKLLVVTRNNHDFEEIVKEKYYIYKDNIISANVKPRETSSTQIRSLIKSGVGREELLKYLDENVIDYIEENNLYK